MVVRLPGSVTQYALLETMREYGRERLAGQRLNRLRRAHAEQFARLVASTAQDLFGPQHLSDVRDLASCISTSCARPTAGGSPMTSRSAPSWSAG